MTVQGLAPFGADIAVLVHNPALDGSSPRPPNNLTAAAALSGGTASDATGVSTELQHERPELKIFTWAREEVAADALSITGTCYACILAMLCIWCCFAGPLGHLMRPMRTSMRKCTSSDLGCCCCCVHQRWISAGLYVIQLCMWQTDLLRRVDAAPCSCKRSHGSLLQPMDQLQKIQVLAQ